MLTEVGDYISLLQDRDEGRYQRDRRTFEESIPVAISYYRSGFLPQGGGGRGGTLALPEAVCPHPKILSDNNRKLT